MATLATLATLAMATPAQAHSKGCHTSTCDTRAYHHWQAHHQQVITRFDLCVANRENGEPGSTSYSTINWHAVNDYYGAYSFLEGTWKEAGGRRYAYNASQATPEQQSIIFNYWSARHPGAWPNTIPPCR